MSELPRVTVWNEYRQEKTDDPVAQIYPEGMHAPIAKHLEAAGFPVRVATLDEAEHGKGSGLAGDRRVVDQTRGSVRGRTRGGLVRIAFSKAEFCRETGKGAAVTPDEELTRGIEESALFRVPVGLGDVSG